jgi:hypothetical protein
MCKVVIKSGQIIREHNAPAMSRVQGKQSGGRYGNKRGFPAGKIQVSPGMFGSFIPGMDSFKSRIRRMNGSQVVIYIYNYGHSLRPEDLNGLSQPCVSKPLEYHHIRIHVYIHYTVTIQVNVYPAVLRTNHLDI